MGDSQRLSWSTAAGLVPDEVMIGLVRERSGEPDAARGKRQARKPDSKRVTPTGVHARKPLSGGEILVGGSAAGNDWMVNLSTGSGFVMQRSCRSKRCGIQVLASHASPMEVAGSFGTRRGATGPSRAMRRCSTRTRT